VRPEEQAVCLEDVVKEYGSGAQRILALDHLSLAVPPGGFVAVTGPSGSGKSTLLHVVAGLDAPTSGRVWVAGREIEHLSDDERTRGRRDRIGVVHQFFNLLPTLSVRENVALPGLLAGRPAREMLARADALLDEVGLAARSHARPHTLSGGEMQRAAIARALVQGPGLVLADEPTGNLDSRAAAQVLEILTRLGRTHGATVLLVTHNAMAAAAARRVVELRDGRVVADRTAAGGS
jgi:putative ABC transport system ATP-binding protein